jgi:hypothetical protein
MTVLVWVEVSRPAVYLPLDPSSISSNYPGLLHAVRLFLANDVHVLCIGRHFPEWQLGFDDSLPLLTVGK